MPYEPGQWVRLLADQLGTEQGPSPAHGDGEMREIPAGSICEVFGVDRTTGWLTVHFELEDSGPKEPYRVEAIVEPDDVEPSRPRPAVGWDGALPDAPADL